MHTNRRIQLPYASQVILAIFKAPSYSFCKLTSQPNHTFWLRCTIGQRREEDKIAVCMEGCSGEGCSGENRHMYGGLQWRKSPYVWRVHRHCSDDELLSSVSYTPFPPCELFFAVAVQRVHSFLETSFNIHCPSRLPRTCPQDVFSWFFFSFFSPSAVAVYWSRT
jgi:hypothetical protein